MQIGKRYLKIMGSNNLKSEVIKKLMNADFRNEILDTVEIIAKTVKDLGEIEISYYSGSVVVKNENKKVVVYVDREEELLRDIEAEVRSFIRFAKRTERYGVRLEEKTGTYVCDAFWGWVYHKTYSIEEFEKCFKQMMKIVRKAKEKEIKEKGVAFMCGGTYIENGAFYIELYILRENTEPDKNVIGVMLSK